jgi:hypothetical protein
MSGAADDLVWSRRNRKLICAVVTTVMMASLFCTAILGGLVYLFTRTAPDFKVGPGLGVGVGGWGRKARPWVCRQARWPGQARPATPEARIGHEPPEPARSAGRWPGAPSASRRAQGHA